MTAENPHLHRRAAQIYAATVVASYGALAAFFGVAKVMHVPLLSQAAIVTWWALLAGPSMLLAGLALYTAHSAAFTIYLFWFYVTMIVCSLPITLLPVYFIARASTRRARALATVCQVLWSGSGWIGLYLLGRVFPGGGP
ncbi:MAG: hypothetical protein U0470_09145 [Anaerolineae bacterium]